MKILVRVLIVVFVWALVLGGVWTIVRFAGSSASPGTHVLVYEPADANLDSRELLVAIEELEALFEARCGQPRVEVGLAPRSGVEVRIQRTERFEEQRSAVKRVMRAAGRASFRLVADARDGRELDAVFASPDYRRRLDDLGRLGLPPVAPLTEETTVAPGVSAYEWRPIAGDRFVPVESKFPSGFVHLAEGGTPLDKPLHGFAYGYVRCGATQDLDELFVLCYRQSPDRRIAANRQVVVAEAQPQPRPDGLFDVNFKANQLLRSVLIQSASRSPRSKVIVLLIDGSVRAVVREIDVFEYKVESRSAKNEADSLVELLTGPLMSVPFQRTPVQTYEIAPSQRRGHHVRERNRFRVRRPRYVCSGAARQSQFR